MGSKKIALVTVHGDASGKITGILNTTAANQEFPEGVTILRIDVASKSERSFISIQGDFQSIVTKKINEMKSCGQLPDSVRVVHVSAAYDGIEKVDPSSPGFYPKVSFGLGIPSV